MPGSLPFAWTREWKRGITAWVYQIKNGNRRLAGQDGKSYIVSFALNISQDVLLTYYEGAAKSVVAKTLDGRNIQFPANILRQFVTAEGVQGLFEMEFDENNKFLAMRRIAS